jgi:hypothetical protein
MNKNKIIVELTAEQLDFLRNLADDVAFELEGFQAIRTRDKSIAHKAEIARDIEVSLQAAHTVPATI